LLKLRKIELLGFKSFCEKTAITFSGSGITCIVGPNGCGKSNIVDAMSWVLGEQSHKSLRAERMSDCIFNGTQKRPPMGMSEVMITLEDPELAEAARFVLEAKEEEEAKAAGEAESSPGELSSEENIDAEASENTEIAEENANKKPFQRKREPKPLMNVKPGEVVVGRRLYRSGQSEYIINGRVARLRDVQELFMGTGLGPESYAIIEQGRIGQVLSSKPTDRRGIIEEAAGVTKYKTKRRLAEAKLEGSKLNLARVNDIVVEIEKQLASLKRQASKARRYAEIREQMRGLLRQLLGSKARELDVEAERLENLLRETSVTEQQETESLRALESEQERLSTRNYELETELRQNQNLLGQTALELDRAENRIGFNRERMKELDARGLQLGSEIEQTSRQARELAARVEAHRQSVAAARAERESLQTALEELVNRAANFAIETQAGELRLEALRVSVARLSNELTKLHGEQAQAEGSLEHHSESRERVEQAEQQIRSEWTEYRERALVATATWQAAEAEAQQLEKSVKNWQTRIIGLRHEQHTTSTYFDRMREQLAGIRARRESLEQILAERSYTADAVQKLFAANGASSPTANSFRAVGVLADYAEVQEQYEGAVEQYLREELEYVVVETFDHARAGIQMLRDEVGGRATFFVDSLKKLNLPAMEAGMPFEPGQGVVSRLDQVVEFRDPLGPAAKQFLPRLRSAFLVDSPAAAEKLAREYPQYQFVTTDGTCYSGRTVSGGRPGEAGPLAIKREMRALEAQGQQFEHDADEAKAILQRVEEELRGAEKSIEETIGKHMQAEKALVAAAHTRDQSLAETARLERQLADYGAELARLRGEMESAKHRAALAHDQHESAVRARAADEDEMGQTTARLAALRGEMQSHQEDLGARRAELAAANERLASAEMIEQRLAEESREAREREASQRQQQAGVEHERGELAGSTVELQRQMETLAAEKTRLEERKVQQEQEWEQARTRAVQVDDALRMARQKLGDLREQRSQHEIARARNDSDRQHLRETCLTELNQHPEDLLAQELQILTGEELAAADVSYHEMKEKIEAMGPVNMMALEEYQECEQRYTFLSRERDDLIQSITDTQQTIKELDEVSRQKFEEAFVVINKNFAECFRILFGGGTGEMRLTEPDSSGDTGIDIVAQPPGKRLQNVLLLSGGEKAMTALALLIAIFRYQPSPFCILDEVDAPLDETNVGRFTKLVAEMSGQAQFLIVTHNKRTMEMAEVLYGVTMQEPGVSKLVSVKWEGEGAGPKERATAA
jgi:chromosome segregation protein